MPRPLSVMVRNSVGTKFDLDEIGMSGQRLVHRIVDDFGEQMMQRLLVGAADIHARTAANRLETFQHLDVARGCSRLPALVARDATLSGARALGSDPNRSLALALVFDFNGFGMFFSCVARVSCGANQFP